MGPCLTKPRVHRSQQRTHTVNLTSPGLPTLQQKQSPFPRQQEPSIRPGPPSLQNPSASPRGPGPSSSSSPSIPQHSTGCRCAKCQPDLYQADGITRRRERWTVQCVEDCQCVYCNFRRRHNRVKQGLSPSPSPSSHLRGCRCHRCRPDMYQPDGITRKRGNWRYPCTKSCKCTVCEGRRRDLVTRLRVRCPHNGHKLPEDQQCIRGEVGYCVCNLGCGNMGCEICC
jgi:hypothetical protein